MKLTINGQELELHYSFRMFIIYENIMSKSIDFETLTSYTGMVTLLYSAIIATMQRNKMDISSLGYDDFMEWLDTQSPDIFTEFATWFTKAMNVQQKLTAETTEKVKKAKPSKKV